MHPARIAELLQPFLCRYPPPKVCHSEPAPAGEEPAVLSFSQLQAISIYIDLLGRWNARINLTAIRDPEEIVTRHFGESLFAASHLFPTPAADFSATTHVGTAAPGCAAKESSAVFATEGRKAFSANIDDPEAVANRQRPTTNDRITLADLGSGAGFPGVPIKLWAPEISLTLIESNHKKATFLREVTRALTLTDVDIQTTRAETLTDLKFDVVTLRAVERFESIIPVAATLVSPGGRLALLISSSQQAQAQASSLPDFSWPTPEPIPLSRSRVLAIAHRHSET
jgi:16S rRNA (guanine527-N7)-methyltransferase